MEVITCMVTEQAEFGHNFDSSKEDKFIHNINEILYLLNLISKSNFFTKKINEFVYMYIVSHPVLKKNIHINLFKKHVYYYDNSYF
jgi:uncharacterized membrane protein